MRAVLLTSLLALTGCGGDDLTGVVSYAVHEDTRPAANGWRPGDDVLSCAGLQTAADVAGADADRFEAEAHEMQGDPTRRATTYFGVNTASGRLDLAHVHRARHYLLMQRRSDLDCPA